MKIFTRNSKYAAGLLSSTALLFISVSVANAQTRPICMVGETGRIVESSTSEESAVTCNTENGNFGPEYIFSTGIYSTETPLRAQRVAALDPEVLIDLSDRLHIAEINGSFEAIETQLISRSNTNRQSQHRLIAEVAAPNDSSTQTVSTVPSSKPTGGLPYLRGQTSAEIGWHFSGYADATYTRARSDGETTADLSKARINPAFHFLYKELILLEAELEIALDDAGETEVELEYVQADIFLHDNATLVVGQYLSPVGQFQERLHPSWINRMGNAPAGFGHDGVQPANDVGAMIRGGISLGSSIATYSVAIGNGPSVSHEGGISFEAKSADDNGNKAISGRFGLLPITNFEFGGSFLFADVTGVSEEGDEHAEEEEEEHGAAEIGTPLLNKLTDHEATDAGVKLWGADAAYTGGAWDIRAEYLKATRDPINSAFEGAEGIAELPNLELEAWYAQIAYRLSGITENKILGRFEPVVRYGEFEVVGLEELAEEAAEKRFDVGLNYWIAPSIVTRAVFEKRKFTARHDDEPDSETRILMQFSYGF